jgi:tetraacyldisaccharide 4''-kinase
MQKQEGKINYLLFPFAVLYGLVTEIRNKLFDRKILPVEEFSVPVICVGNLTVGGTGKTPHIEYLIRMLMKTHRIAVLSRGYKRKTSGFVLADTQSNSLTIGDEPYQIYKKFPGIIVAVDEKRCRGIRKLLTFSTELRPEVILLDDAFQHRYVKPGLSILLTDIHRPIYDDCLLPVGRLRELVRNKSRADVVIVTKCPLDIDFERMSEISKRLNLRPGQSLFFSSFRYGNLIPVFMQAPILIPEEIQKKYFSILLISGIANPSPLVHQLRRYASILETLQYPDHHHFSESDIKNIQHRFDQIEGQEKIIVTTEKDATRLINHGAAFDNDIKKRMYYLPVEVFFNFDKEIVFNKIIREHVEKDTRNDKLD